MAIPVGPLKPGMMSGVLRIFQTNADGGAPNSRLPYSAGLGNALHAYAWHARKV